MYQAVLLFRTSSNFWFQKMGMLFFFGFPILLVKPCSLQGQGEIYVMTNLTERAKRWLSNGEFAIDPHDFWGSKTFQFGEICWFDSHKTNDEFSWDPPLCPRRLCSGGELQQRWETEAYEEQDVIEVTDVSSGLLQRVDAVTTGATC